MPPDILPYVLAYELAVRGAHNTLGNKTENMDKKYDTIMEARMKLSRLYAEELLKTLPFRWGNPDGSVMDSPLELTDFALGVLMTSWAFYVMTRKEAEKGRGCDNVAYIMLPIAANSNITSIYEGIREGREQSLKLSISVKDDKRDANTDKGNNAA